MNLTCIFPCLGEEDHGGTAFGCCGGPELMLTLNVQTEEFVEWTRGWGGLDVLYTSIVPRTTQQRNLRIKFRAGCVEMRWSRWEGWVR